MFKINQNNKYLSVDNVRQCNFVLVQQTVRWQSYVVNNLGDVFVEKDIDQALM